MVNAQEWLDKEYPKEQRNTIKRLGISIKSFTGNLDLSDFINLEELNCGSNKLTTLNLTNCQQLKILNCEYNKLTDLKLPSSTEQLTWWLSISNNNLSGDLSIFSHLVNLKVLWIDNNNHFTGSLKSLQNLTKLEILSISNTDIDSGLEYLPDSLEYFRCSAYERKDAKCQTIYKLFANDQGKVETDECGYIKNFPQKLQEYKTNLKNNWKNLNFSEEEINQWMKIGLNLSTDYNFANYLKLKGYQPNQDLNLTELRKEYQQELEKHRKFYDLGIDNATLHQRWKKTNQHLILQGQLELLQEQKEKLLQRITDLETLTQESERLIKEQKSKVGENIKNYLPLFEEEDKQSVEKLIKVHKAHKEAEKAKQWNEAEELFEEFSNVRKKLKNKLGKDFMEIIAMVLANLEELYQREWDLTKQLQEKEQIPSSLKAIEKGIADIKKDIKAIETNPNQVVNNYITVGDIEVKGGHALIGNTFGEQANIVSNYATTIEEVEKVEFEAKIQQAETYGIPGSSK
ncbi:MAG: hypothetical protein MRECE_18c016 [Mycoplasmataceae bacterium CE_OT135]|nr:MAG: hypothetical protein MRECE_29c016 [Mycoplasmataceae bacterium CE_OT135]KLL03368.1 MAG: hypothetical protein MRECE_18c016 [Mycoplasmataceae bacterium CE_OT135]